MALHTGEADLRAGDYYGAAVNRCARLRAIAYGAQTLVSMATEELVRDTLPPHLSLRDLGEHRMRDLARPEHVFQLLQPDVAGDFPPLRSLNSVPHNLPIQLTALVGRERELAELRRLQTTTRLLTLTGTGGCGKTRLALQAAAEAVDMYPDGVWLAELTPLIEPALVALTVAAAVGVPEQPGRPALATLVQALGTRRLLLVLDNCEHLVEASARLVDALLRGCPGVQILVTSREVLGITGEVGWHVPSLAVPPNDQPATLESVTQYEAVRLFVDRSVAVLPTFTITNQNAPAVVQICRRLDGIPLAIELAAARVKVLSPNQIAERLDDRFRLLTGGSRTALPRQQTLRALVDWSYELLSEPEKALLRRLSVFAGGWTLEAAEATCAGEGIQPDDVLDLLESLVLKSLVVVEPEGHDPDLPRYKLLETTRAYAADRRRECGEFESLGDRHLAWAVDWAERSLRHLTGQDQVRWMARFADEHDNFRTALEWTRTRGDGGSELRLGAALARFWHFPRTEQ